MTSSKGHFFRSTSLRPIYTVLLVRSVDNIARPGLMASGTHATVNDAFHFFDSEMFLLLIQMIEKCRSTLYDGHQVAVDALDVTGQPQQPP